MAAEEPRKYDSSRRQSSGRERVLDAALSVARSIGTWNWADITFKAVAEEAGVSERTIYRHFPTQRDLHEAMMIRINKQAAISYEGLSLDDVPTVVDRLFTSLATFTPRSAGAPPPPGALVAMDRERILSLLEATDGNKQQAAVLDILWSVEAYERLVVNWRMSTEQAIETITWALGQLREGQPGKT